MQWPMKTSLVYERLKTHDFVVAKMRRDEIDEFRSVSAYQDGHEKQNVQW